jgi:hypothetical protein
LVNAVNHIIVGNGHVGRVAPAELEVLVGPQEDLATKSIGTPRKVKTAWEAFSEMDLRISKA